MSGGKDWNNLDGGSGKPHAKQDGKPDLQELMRRRFQNRPSSTVSDSDNNASPTPFSQPVSGGAFRPLSQGAQRSSGGQNAQGAHRAQNATATDNNGNFVYENNFENSAVQHGSAFRSNTDKGHGIKHQSKNDQRGGQSSQTATPEVFENNFEDMEPAGASGSHGNHRDASGGSQKGVRTGYSENLGYPGSETGKTKGSPAGQGRDTHEMAQFGERRIPPGSQAPVHFAGFGGMGGVSGATASPQSVPKNDTGEEGAAASRWNTNMHNRYSAPGKTDPMAQLLAFAEAHKNDSDSEETTKKRKEEEKKVLQALEQEDLEFVSRLQNNNQNKQQEERQNDGMIRHGRGGRGGGFSMQGIGHIDEKELKEMMRGKDGKSGIMGEQISEEKMIELSQEMIGFGKGKKENKDNQSENVDQKLKRMIDQGCVDQDGKVDPVRQMLAGMGAGQVEDGVENPMTKMLNDARMNEGQGQGQDDGGGGDPFAQLLSGMQGMGRGQRRGQGGGGVDPFAGMGGMGAGQGGGQGGNPADPIAQFMSGVRGRGGGQAGNPIGPFMGGVGGVQGGNNANQFGQMMGSMSGGGGGQKKKMEEEKEGPASKQGSGGQMNEDELLAQTMSGMSQGDKGRQGSGQLGMREDPLAQIVGGMRGGRQGGPDRNAMAGLMGGGGQGGPNMNMLAQMMGGGGLAGRGGGGGNPMAQMMDGLMGGSGPAGGGGNPMAQMLGGMMGRGGRGGGGGMDPMQLMAQMAGGGGGGGGGMNPMQLMSQMAGGGMGRGGNDDQVAAMAQMMGQGRGRGQMMEEDEVIDIENPKEEQMINQMLGYEMMKAANCRDQRSDGMCTIIILDTSASMTGEPMAEAGRFISEFINGLEEAQFEYGLEENVAIICVGAQDHVAQHLTCDYTSIRSAIDAQFPEGPSRLHHGLILPLAILTSRDGRDVITSTNGHRVCPRIIVISDGHVNNREDIPGQTPAEGDQETLMLQTTCVDLTQSVRQKTMSTFHCVSVGAANIPFLEMLANSTGGQLIQPADAKKISRCYLHHHLVGLLQKAGTDMSDRSVVAASINQALACSDDEDVNGVMKIFADGEPDIEAHNQALAKEMAELQTQRGQRQGGMQDMQGMMGQLSRGGLPGMMGGGRGGMPAMMGGGRGGMPAMMGGGGGGMPAMMGGGGRIPAMMGGGGRIPAMMGDGGGGMPAMMGGGRGGMPAMMGDGGGGIPAMMGGGGGGMPAMMGSGGGRIPAMLGGGGGRIPAMMRGGRQGEKEADGAGQVGGNEKVGNRQFKAGDISELPTDVITMMGINKNDKPGKASERKDAEASFEGNNGGGKGEGIPDMAQSIGGRKPGVNEGGDGMPDMLAMMGGLGGGGGGGPGGGEGGPGGMPDLSALLSGLAAGKGGSDAGGLPDMSTMMGGGRGVGGMGGMSAMMGGGRGGGGAGGLPDLSAMMGGLGGGRGRGGAGGLPDMSAMMGGQGNGRGRGGAGGWPDMSAMMGGIGGGRGRGSAGGLPDMSAMMGGLGGGGGGAGGLPDMSAMMGGLGGGRGGGGAGGLPDMSAMMGGLGGGRGGGGAGGLPDMSAMMGGRGGGGASGLPDMSAMMGGLGGGGGVGGLPDMSAMMGGLGGGRERGGNASGMPDMPSFLGGRTPDNMSAPPGDGRGGGVGGMSDFSAVLGGGGGGGGGVGAGGMQGLAAMFGVRRPGGGDGGGPDMNSDKEPDDNSVGGMPRLRKMLRDLGGVKYGQDDIENMLRESEGGQMGEKGNIDALMKRIEKSTGYNEYKARNPDGEQPLQDLVGQGQFPGGQAGNAGMQGMGRSQEDQMLYQRNAANNRQSYRPPQQDAQRPSTMGAESGFPQPQRAGGQYQQHGQMRHGQGQGAQGYGQPQQQARPDQYGQARGQQEDYGYGNQDDMSGMEEPD